MKRIEKYLLNRWNILRLFMLIVTGLLLLIAIMYSFGSVLILQLDDFWCARYTWDEITSYHRSINATTGTARSCYISTQIYLNKEKLFATDLNDNALSIKITIDFDHVGKAIAFGILGLVLLIILIKYTVVCLIDCKKSMNNEWNATRVNHEQNESFDANKLRKSITSGLFHLENKRPKLWIFLMKLQSWRDEIRRVDAPPQVLLCLIREGMEIAIQC